MKTNSPFLIVLIFLMLNGCSLQNVYKDKSELNSNLEKKQVIEGEKAKGEIGQVIGGENALANSSDSIGKKENKYQPDQEEGDTVSSDSIFEIVKIPEFKDGGPKGLMKFIFENLSYPEEAFENDIEGKVDVKFIINKDGTVSDIITLNEKLGYGLEEEAIRIIKLTSGLWNPAISENGKVASIYLKMPIVFRLH